MNRFENQPVSVFPFGALSSSAARIGAGVLAGLGDELLGCTLVSSPVANFRNPERTPPSGFAWLVMGGSSAEKNGILSLPLKKDSSAGLGFVMELSEGLVDIKLERDFLKGLNKPVSSEAGSGFGSGNMGVVCTISANSPDDSVSGRSSTDPLPVSGKSSMDPLPELDLGCASEPLLGLGTGVARSLLAADVLCCSNA